MECENTSCHQAVPSAVRRIEEGWASFQSSVLHHPQNTQSKQVLGLDFTVSWEKMIPVPVMGGFLVLDLLHAFSSGNPSQIIWNLCWMKPTHWQCYHKLLVLSFFLQIWIYLGKYQFRWQLNWIWLNTMNFSMKTVVKNAYSWVGFFNWCTKFNTSS